MRLLADPIRREQMLHYYRQGYKHVDVAKVFEVTEGTVRREMQLDPVWADQVQEAMGVAFKPTLQRAIELAEMADPEGEMEGSHKAMALVMNFYTKVLDREHAAALLERKGEIAREIEGNRPAPAPVLSSPEQIAALASGLMDAARKEADTIDGEVVEE